MVGDDIKHGDDIKYAKLYNPFILILQLTGPLLVITSIHDPIKLLRTI